MDVPYFSQNDHTLLETTSARECTLLLERARDLQKAVSRRMRDLNWDLYSNWDGAAVVPGQSTSSRGPIFGLTIPFLRSREQALSVERMMGRDGAGQTTAADWMRHPVIELRLTPDAFCVELVVSPSAWWDQRNLVGKLSLPRHRDALRALLGRADGDLRIGFWDGAYLSDFALTSRQLIRSGALGELMTTFGDSQDWMRAGMWYTPEDPRLSETNIVPEVCRAIGTIYPLYQFLLWTSNNNFQSFHPANAWMSSQREAQA
jgi:hypothetical protein